MLLIFVATTTVAAGMLLYQPVSTQLIDPAPAVADDERYVTTISYGWPLTIYRKVDTACYCSPPVSTSYDPQWFNIMGVVAATGVAAVVLRLRR